MRVAFDELTRVLATILATRGMDAGRRELCARLFAETDQDGVYTHGVNRFHRFIRMIDACGIDVHAAPVVAARVGSLERWDGGRVRAISMLTHAWGGRLSWPVSTGSDAWHCQILRTGCAAGHTGGRQRMQG